MSLARRSCHAHPIGSTVDFDLSRFRTPTGTSYPLGRDEVDAALTDAGVVSLSVLRMLVPTHETWRDAGWAPVLVARYLGDTPQPGRGEHALGVCDLDLFAVPSVHRRAIGDALRAGPLGRVARWVAATDRQAPTWRMVDHELAIQVDTASPPRLRMEEV